MTTLIGIGSAFLAILHLPFIASDDFRKKPGFSMPFYNFLDLSGNTAKFYARRRVDQGFLKKRYEQ